MKITAYALLLILSTIAGWLIAYEGLVVPIPIPPGNWQKIGDISHNEFGVEVGNLRLLAVDYWDDTFFISAQGDHTLSIRECNLKTGHCFITALSKAPWDPEITLFTRDINKSEIPPMPSARVDYVDLIKTVRNFRLDIAYRYYVLFPDGSIWSWGYYSVLHTFSIVERFLYGVVGSVLGIVAAIIIIILNVKSPRKAAKSDVER